MGIILLKKKKKEDVAEYERKDAKGKIIKVKDERLPENAIRRTIRDELDRFHKRLEEEQNG
jgi:hypothetical protein